MDNENTTTVATETAPRIKGKDAKVKLSTVMELLKQGKTRKEIKTELELTNNQAKKLFGHDKIKGKKRHYTKNITKAEIEVEDDLPEDEEGDENENAGEQDVQAVQSNGDGAIHAAAPVAAPQTAPSGVADEW